MKIVKAKVVVDYIVELTLDDGRVVERDFSLLRGPVFDPIMRDRRKFRKLRIVDGVLVWPGDVDVDPDGILRHNCKGPVLKRAIVGGGCMLLSATPITRFTDTV